MSPSLFFWLLLTQYHRPIHLICFPLQAHPGPDPTLNDSVNFLSISSDAFNDTYCMNTGI